MILLLLGAWDWLQWIKWRKTGWQTLNLFTAPAYSTHFSSVVSISTHIYLMSRCFPEGINHRLWSQHRFVPSKQELHGPNLCFHLLPSILREYSEISCEHTWSGLCVSQDTATLSSKGLMFQTVSFPQTGFCMASWGIFSLQVSSTPKAGMLTFTVFNCGQYSGSFWSIHTYVYFVCLFLCFYCSFVLPKKKICNWKMCLEFSFIMSRWNSMWKYVEMH